jgi:hypothetical protein
MAVATVPLGPSKYFLNQLDSLLFEICEELQLPPYRYNQADERYHAVSEVLEADGSPLSPFRPRIYPQGSMRLGTTVRPITGPHDLDFVCELSLSHALVEPIKLLQALHSHLKQHGTYRDMVSLKKRCVRITYANEFYMDLLPACQDHDAGGTCIQVPDRDTRSWKPSDPIGYAKWFKGKSTPAVRKFAADSAEPLPALQAVEDKAPLQLSVQLIKRWRDIHYADAPTPAPISIVLTTLAADAYRGEGSVSEAIASILHGILEAVRAAESSGHRLKVLNPSNILEDLSERWDDDEEAYRGFKAGIQQLSRRWDALLLAGGNQNAELERLFGEPVKTVLEKRAERLHESRFEKKLSVTSAGVISAWAGSVRIPANTFHGSK